jgi:two-component system response regulator HydG
VKLLRVLQHREVIPVGATDPVAIDTRLLAATNRDLEEEIRRGGFRTDLFYRLNVFALHLPPLRDRREDVVLLAEGFLARTAAQRGRGAEAALADGGGAAHGVQLAGGTCASWRTRSSAR